MDVLVTCKYEEYPIKSEGARVLTTLYINISDVWCREDGGLSLEFVACFVAAWHWGSLAVEWRVP